MPPPPPRPPQTALALPTPHAGFGERVWPGHVWKRESDPPHPARPGASLVPILASALVGRQLEADDLHLRWPARSNATKCPVPHAGSHGDGCSVAASRPSSGAIIRAPRTRRPRKICPNCAVVPVQRRCNSWLVQPRGLIQPPLGGLVLGSSREWTRPSPLAHPHRGAMPCPLPGHPRRGPGPLTGVLGSVQPCTLSFLALVWSQLPGCHARNTHLEVRTC